MSRDLSDIEMADGEVGGIIRFEGTGPVGSEFVTGGRKVVSGDECAR